MKLICVLLTIFALGATPAYADDNAESKEFKLVTECETIPLKDSKRDLCGVTLEEWTRILKTNLGYTSRGRLLQYNQLKNDKLEVQKTALQKSLESMADSQKVLQERVGKVTKDLIAKDKKLQYEIAKPRWGNPVAWTIAAVATAVATTLLVREALD